MNVLAIIVAAGQGVRMGAGRPKALLRLGGMTLLERSLAAFLSHPRVDRVVAAVPDPDEVRRLLGPSGDRVVLVRGGTTRQESVRCALLGATSMGDEIILVHDAARPLVTRALIDAVIASAEESGAAIPGLVPPDTIKQVDEEGAAVATLPRERLRLAQTPQGFRGDVLRDAHARAERDGFVGTDDAALVERTGRRVALVEGSQRNIKITNPGDLALAEAILARETAGGHGG